MMIFLCTHPLHNTAKLSLQTCFSFTGIYADERDQKLYFDIVYPFGSCEYLSVIHIVQRRSLVTAVQHVELHISTFNNT